MTESDDEELARLRAENAALRGRVPVKSAGVAGGVGGLALGCLAILAGLVLIVLVGSWLVPEVGGPETDAGMPGTLNARDRANMVFACGQAMVTAQDNIPEMRQAQMIPPWRGLTVQARSPRPRVLCPFYGDGSSGEMIIDVRCMDPNDLSCAEIVEIRVAGREVYSGG